ncbi:MAG: hypothetical protein NC453_08845 [Muribaculum sp.]|nr:hypothetical protein [Muribaculum sp.]
MTNISSLFNRLYFIVGVPWLCLVIFTSRTLTDVKIILLVILMAFSFVDILVEKIKINIYHLGFVIIFLIYSMFSLLIGLCNNYEFNFVDDFGIIQYFFFTPICVLLFSTTIGTFELRKQSLWSILLYLTCILTVFDSLKVITNVMGMPLPFLGFIEMASERVQEAELTLRVRNEASLFFLLPIFIFHLFNTDNKKERSISLITVIFGCIYAALSGRKVLELEILFSFLFSILFRRDLKIYFKRNVVKILIGFAILIIVMPFVSSYLSFLVGVDNISDMIYNTIESGLSSGSEGVTKRVQNTNALINLWFNSPLFGNGLIAYAHESTAGFPKWSYEVFYIAWLAQTGLMGFCLLAYAIIYIMKKLILKGNCSHDRRYYALALGFLCFVIAGASNPLLYFVWPWSIALIYCNNSVKLRYNRS